jgi:hypothetical protein
MLHGVSDCGPEQSQMTTTPLAKKHDRLENFLLKKMPHDLPSGKLTWLLKMAQ